MLGSIRQVIRGIEITDEALSVDVIRDVCLNGPGHFLGHAQTLDLMNSTYEYPALASLEPADAWVEAGGPDLRQKAKARAREILSGATRCISDELDHQIRQRFPIIADPTQTALNNFP